MRFFLITVLVALAHLAISGALFFVALAGIGAMTAEQSRISSSAYTGLSVWNCAPEAANQFLVDHVYSPLKTTDDTPNWTEEDQIALAREYVSRSAIRYLLFLIWPFVIGSIVATADSNFQKRRLIAKASQGRARDGTS